MPAPVIHGFDLRDEDGNTLRGETVLDIHALFVGLVGYSNAVVTADRPIVCLELHENKPRLLVFADYNSEAPTHTIDLSGAKTPAEEGTEDAHGS